MNFAETCVFFSFEILSWGTIPFFESRIFLAYTLAKILSSFRTEIFATQIFLWKLGKSFFRNPWMNSLRQKSLKAESLENLLDSSWKTLAKILSSMDNLWIKSLKLAVCLHQMLRWVCESLAKISSILQKFYRIIMSKPSRSLPRNPV